jgi:hypothetical protein
MVRAVPRLPSVDRKHEVRRRRKPDIGLGPRRIAIVAVARRLAIALWRYLKDGVIPERAHLKSA